MNQLVPLAGHVFPALVAAGAPPVLALRHRSANHTFRATGYWHYGRRNRRYAPESGPVDRRPALLPWAKDRDRGEPRGSTPPTPPYVRVRIRRFEKLR
jgi:hypothetical protein